jgi:ClpP class serine protease
MAIFLARRRRNAIHIPRHRSYCAKLALEVLRIGAIRSLEKHRGSRVIALIHRQESVNVLGIPIVRYIDIADSEEILRAIRLTDKDTPIDLILHTPGGLVLAASQIARAVKRHPAKTTVFVPHYAMSGGTLIALASKEIVMDEKCGARTDRSSARRLSSRLDIASYRAKTDPQDR